MRLPGIKKLRFINHPELKKRDRCLGLQGKEDNSQEEGKSRYFVNQCLPCHTDKSSWCKELPAWLSQ